MLRFTVPVGGSYSVDMFGGRRKPGVCGDHTDLSLYTGLADSIKGFKLIKFIAGCSSVFFLRWNDFAIEDTYYL